MSLAVKFAKSVNHARQLSPLGLSAMRSISSSRSLFMSPRPIDAKRCMSTITSRSISVSPRPFAGKVDVPNSFAKAVFPLLNPGPTPGYAIRYMASRTNCAKNSMPRCSPKNLAKSACMKRKKEDAKRTPNVFKSMYHNPECCLDPCPDVLPRFDDLYYKISNKAKRKYMQTWKECPRLKIATRKLCCYENLPKPPLKKRNKKDKPKTACPKNINASKHLMQCKPGQSGKCPRTILPFCRPARVPPKCKTHRSPSKCKKICTPYPSYSECRAPKKRPLSPIECECLEIRPMCEVWMAWRKMVAHKS